MLGLHGVIAAIGVARVIGLAHAGNDDRQTPTIGQRASQREKQQIAPRHKSIGQTVGLHGKRYIVGQRRAANLLEHIKREHMILAQTRCPVWKTLGKLLTHGGAHGHLDAVALAVVKAQRLHAFEHGQGLRQTGRGILPAREQHQGRLVLTRACRKRMGVCLGHKAAITSPALLPHPDYI